MKIYVYVIWFPTSDRPNPHYIGIAENLERRMKQHLNSKYFVGRALQKYDDWIVKKLHTCKTYEEAFRIEIEEIRNFNCIAPNGYNLTRGGDGGDTISNNPNREKIIEKMCESHQGKGIGKNNSFYGKHHSEEWKQNKSEEVKGTHHSKETIEKIRAYKHTKEEIEKMKIAKIGNQNAKGKNLGGRNVMHRIDVKYKRLKTRIANLEKDK